MSVTNKEKNFISAVVYLHTMVPRPCGSLRN